MIRLMIDVLYRGGVLAPNEDASLVSRSHAGAVVASATSAPCNVDEDAERTAAPVGHLVSPILTLSVSNLDFRSDRHVHLQPR